MCSSDLNKDRDNSTYGGQHDERKQDKGLHGQTVYHKLKSDIPEQGCVSIYTLGQKLARRQYFNFEVAVLFIIVESFH